MDGAVKVDDIVIADTTEVEWRFAVPAINVFYSEVSPFGRGTAMNDDFIDLSHLVLMF